MDELGALPEQREAQWFAQEGKSPLTSCSGLHIIGVHRLQYEIHTEFCTASDDGLRMRLGVHAQLGSFLCEEMSLGYEARRGEREERRVM